MPPIGKKYWTGCRGSNYQWFKIFGRRRNMQPRTQSLWSCVVVLLFNLTWLATSRAQLLPITTRVVTINNLAVAALRHPTDPGPKAKIGIFIMHPDGSYVNNV